MLKIAQLSCGTEYAGVQGILEKVAEDYNIQLVFPDVGFDEIEPLSYEIGLLPASPSLKLMIARAVKVLENSEDYNGVFILTCFKCAEGTYIRNEIRRLIHQNTPLPIITYNVVENLKISNLRIRLEALRTIITRKDILMRTKQEGLTIGIDSGSSTTKGVLMEENEVTATSWIPTTTVLDTASKVLESLLNSANIKLGEIDGVGVTGYGRIEVGKMLKAKLVQEEISVNSKGAAFLANQQKGNATVVDVGGLDNKVITLFNGLPDDFTMGGACAGASGRFLELTARRLGVTLDELGKIAMEGNPENVHMDSYCSIFGIQSLVSALSEGAKREDVAAAACFSVAEQIIQQQMEEIEIRPPIIQVGGTALIKGLNRAFSSILGTKVIVPEYPQFAGAIGAALLVSSFI
jgi:putative methanogenesis marker protein 15